MKTLAIFRKKPYYTTFCIPEAKSLLKDFGINNSVDIFPDDLKGHEQLALEHPGQINEPLFPTFPLVYMNIDDETAKALLERSVLIKAFVKVYYEGKDLAELKENIKKNIGLIQPEMDSTETFAFRVEPLNATLTKEEQVESMNSLEPEIFFQGKVNLKDPKRIFWLLEDWENDNKGNYKLKRIYLSKLIARAAKGEKFFNEKYKLTARAYLGPTSCDNDLAFMMTNLARVKKGDFVLDPFFGTGGLIIPSAHFGAVTFGGELDMRVLQGYGVGRYNPQSKFEITEKRANIWTNFRQYGLQRPEILRMDSSKTPFRKGEIFDAIICDPPYGIRAMVREMGMREKTKNKYFRKKKDKSGAKGGEEEVEGENPDELSGSDEFSDSEESPSKDESSPEKKETKTTETKEGEITTTKEGVSQETKESKTTEGKEPLEEVKLPEKKANETGAPEEEKTNLRDYGQHYLPTRVIKVNEIVEGLYRLGSQVLKVGGRLVFLYPVRRGKWKEEDIPTDKQFRLVEFCENPMNKKMSRICVVAEKLF